MCDIKVSQTLCIINKMQKGGIKMSWLLIDSVVLICNTCDWSLSVNLQDRGAIQIGDTNVAYLYELYCEQQGLPNNDSTIDKFLNTSHAMPLLCTCQNCYATLENETHQHKIDQAMQKLNNYLDKIGAIYHGYTERQNNLDKQVMDAFIEQIDGEWANTVNGKVYGRSLGHDQFSNPANRTRLIKQYVAEGKKEILETAQIYYTQSTDGNALPSEYRQQIDELYKRSLAIIEDLQKAQEEPAVFAYEHADKTKPLNLNNYIRYEGTLGYPIEQVADYNVYFPGRYNLNKAIQWLEEHAEIKPMDVGDKMIINEVRKRLQEILVKRETE